MNIHHGFGFSAMSGLEIFSIPLTIPAEELPQ
jgi:hypothetical protein